MTRETKIAFSELDKRADAMAGDPPLDRISLRDHIVSVEIGAFQLERDMTQRLKFNVVVEVFPVSGDVADDVDKILSYDTVTEAIATELAAERLNLLETLSERIGDRILSEPQAAKVFVRIEKLDRGSGDLGVEIVRTKDAAAPLVSIQSQVPTVVFVPWDVINGPNLGAWIDQLRAAAPVVVCVAPNENAFSDIAGNSGRRIDLLTIEQAAWTLVARAEGCAVVNTRTEMDWSIKNGQLAIWAPSKMVMDAVDGPTCAASDARGLAKWFAGEIGATDVVAIDAGLSPNGGIYGA